jgi:hypothetical protein
MDRKSASQWVHRAAFCEVRHEPSPSSRAESDPTLRLNRGETLIFVLLLSLGLWALIWGAVSVLAACGLR